jgi:hypothetical protein
MEGKPIPIAQIASEREIIYESKLGMEKEIVNRETESEFREHMNGMYFAGGISVKKEKQDCNE